MRRILLSLLIIGVVSGASFRLSSAFFSDTETSENNTFTAGTIDLKMNELDNPTAIVNFNDLKPGDDYLEDKTLRVIDNDAYVWMHIKDVIVDQGVETDPEAEEENGTPQFNINDYLDYQLTVGGQSIISPAIDFSDAVSCWVPLGQVAGGELIDMDQTFSFDESVTNWAQGDTMSFTEEFYAVQARNNDNPTPPVSETGRVWNQSTTSCDNCEVEQGWASGVVSSAQGLRKNNTPITDPNRINPNAATGTNNWTNGGSTGIFALGKNGVITLSFTNPIVNETGNDFTIYEATNGRATYPEEKAVIEVSYDGSTFYSVGTASSLNPNGQSGFDFDTTPLPSVRFIRVTDTTNFGPHANDADGFDLDAVGSPNSCISQ